MSIQPSAPAPEPTGPATPAPAPEPPKKRNLWEIAFTSTPVLLTVIATLLASRSSGELTQGQYSRTVAGQNQAKAGDEWAFFQAKRVRGTVKEAEARRGAFQPSETLAVVKWLPKGLDRTAAEAEAVHKAAEAAQKATDDAAACATSGSACGCDGEPDPYVAAGLVSRPGFTGACPPADAAPPADAGAK